MNVEANPGVYAVLLGSGVSRPAGIKTGWEIVEDLIRKVAATAGEVDAIEAAKNDPAAWFAQTYHEEPSYSSVLAMLAETSHERQSLLNRYFEPDEDEREQSLKVPTVAHHAIARLVQDGYVKVIVTTNFDRLMEQALRVLAIEPIVLSTPDAIRGAIPLAHSNCTMVKLHGDYQDTQMLNTVAELTEYSPATNKLLDQILDEYGLIISGWSGMSDVALVAAIDRAPNRRYTTFWAFPRIPSDIAQPVIIKRAAKVLTGHTADSLFQRLAENVQALDDLARPEPLSPRIAAQTVKNYMLEDRQKIRLHDLTMKEVESIRNLINDNEQMPLSGPWSGDLLHQRMRTIESRSAKLMAMYAVAGYWADEEHISVWLKGIARLSQFEFPVGNYYDGYASLRRYPALLAMYSFCLSAISAGKYENVLSMFNMDIKSLSDLPAGKLAAMLCSGRILELRYQKNLPGMDNNRIPLSLRLSLLPELLEAQNDFLSDAQNFNKVFDWLEYLLSICGFYYHGWAPVGVFAFRNGNRAHVGLCETRRQLTSELELDGTNHWLLDFEPFGSSLETIRQTKTEFEQSFQN